MDKKKKKKKRKSTRKSERFIFVDIKLWNIFCFIRKKYLIDVTFLPWWERKKEGERERESKKRQQQTNNQTNKPKTN